MPRVFLAILALVTVVTPIGANPPMSLGLSLASGLKTLSEREPQRISDPFPIRRVLLPERAPLPVAPDGDPFRRMTRDDFERLVRDAGRNLPTTPKLIRAEYRASLVNDALVGTGEWQFASEKEGVFPLDTLKMAVRDAKWNGGRDARLYGSPARLWVDQLDRSPVRFEWSARGSLEPGAIKFALGAPASPLAILELELSNDRWPVTKGPVLLDGPIAKPGNRSLWRFAFGGESVLEFSVREPVASRPSAFAALARSTKLEVSPGLATVSCEFDTAIPRDTPTEIAFRIDPGLTIADVVSAGLANWRVNGDALTLTYREPFSGGKITVIAVSPFPADGNEWSIPTIHPAAGVTVADQIDLLVSPDLLWEGCTPGDYRPVRSTMTSERGLAITWRGTLPKDNRTARQAPSLRLRGAAAEFSTVETLDWRIEAERTRLSVRIKATVSRGPLARFVFRVPPGAVPIATVVTPDDPTATLIHLGNNIYAIEPTQPVPTGESLEIRIDLNGPKPIFDPDTQRASLVLDSHSVLGATKRDGTANLQFEAPLRGWYAVSETAAVEGNGSFKFIRDHTVRITLARRNSFIADPPEIPTAKAIAGDWRFRRLVATAVIEPDGQIFVKLTGRIRTAKAVRLPIRLPAGAILQQAMIEGKWTDAIIQDGTALLTIPDPDPAGLTFELGYRVPSSGTWPLRLTDCTPGLPGDPPIALSFDCGPQYVAWPTLAKSTQVEAIVLPERIPRAIGLVLAVLLLGTTIGQWLRGRHRHVFSQFVYVVSAGLGAAVWFAPSGWWILIGPPFLAALLSWFVLRVGSVSVLGKLVLLGSVALITGPGIAQAPAIPTVYLLSESSDEPNRLTALVPQSTLDRLNTLKEPQLPAVLLLDAEYSAEESLGISRFDATFKIDVVRPGVQEFELPLAGVQLESMTIDNAPAFPDASRPGRYRLVLEGVGPRVLKARFVVPTTTTAAGRETRFGIPDHPSTRMTFLETASGQSLEFLGRTGARTTIRRGEQSAICTEIGPAGSIAIRWLDLSPPVATVQEATVWDVNETRAEALAAFVHRIERGTMTRLVFELPMGIEPGSLTVREVDSTPGTVNGLRDWILEPIDTGTRLTLVLRHPARNPVITTIRLFHRDKPTIQPILPVPHTVTGDVTASYVGIRLNGVTAESWENRNLIDVPMDAFIREFAQIPELELERPFTRSLRREGANPPILSPILRAPAIPLPAVRELLWSIGSTADVTATLQWSNAAAPVVECPVPTGVVVSEVLATDVAGWERSGDLLRVWFKSDLRDPTVKWIGRWQEYPSTEAFELPSLPGATVRVRPTDGATLEVITGPGSKLTPGLRPREWSYTTEAAAPRFRWYPPTSPKIIRTDALVRTGSQFELRTVLEIPLAPGRPHSFELSIANMPNGAESRIEWPPGTTGLDAGSTSVRKSWTMEIPILPERSARVAVITRLPVRTTLELPSIDLLSANVPLARSAHTLSLPEEFRPIPTTARRENGRWTILSDGPISLIEQSKPTVRSADDDSEVSNVDAGIPANRKAREGQAVIWLLGWLILGIWSRLGPQGLHPEWLIGYGVLAAGVADWKFLGIAVLGACIRFARLARMLGRRVIR